MKFGQGALAIRVFDVNECSFMARPSFVRINVSVDGTWHSWGQKYSRVLRLLSIFHLIPGCCCCLLYCCAFDKRQFWGGWSLFGVCDWDFFRWKWVHHVLDWETRFWSNSWLRVSYCFRHRIIDLLITIVFKGTAERKTSEILDCVIGDNNHWGSSIWRLSPMMANKEP